MSRTIPYESAATPEPRYRRPAWVYAVVGVYVLILGTVAVLPFVLPLASGDEVYPAAAGVMTLLVLCEVAMLFVPVRVASRRPVTRRSLWFPLLGSATLAALLGFGGSLAVAEYLKADDNTTWVVLAVTGAVWLAWTFAFWLMSLDTGPESVATRLHRWLLAGSVLELLVAVPTHLVVRRRDECCAGIGTAIGICAGVVVMLLAFGPSVGFLYYRRWKQVRRP